MSTGLPDQTIASDNSFEKNVDFINSLEIWISHQALISYILFTNNGTLTNVGMGLGIGDLTASLGFEVGAALIGLTAGDSFGWTGEDGRPHAIAIVNVERRHESA